MITFLAKLHFSKSKNNNNKKKPKMEVLKYGNEIACKPKYENER